MPAANPRIPPAKPMAVASARKNRMIVRTEPPSAFMSPTSRRRSIASPAMAARTPKEVSVRIKKTVAKSRPRMRSSRRPSASASLAHRPHL